MHQMSPFPANKAASASSASASASASASTSSPLTSSAAASGDSSTAMKIGVSIKAAGGGGEGGVAADDGAGAGAPRESSSSLAAAAPAAAKRLSALTAATSASTALSASAAASANAGGHAESSAAPSAPAAAIPAPRRRGRSFRRSAVSMASGDQLTSTGAISVRSSLTAASLSLSRRGRSSRRYTSGELSSSATSVHSSLTASLSSRVGELTSSLLMCGPVGGVSGDLSFIEGKDETEVKSGEAPLAAAAPRKDSVADEPVDETAAATSPSTPVSAAIDSTTWALAALSTAAAALPPPAAAAATPTATNKSASGAKPLPSPACPKPLALSNRARSCPLPDDKGRVIPDMRDLLGRAASGRATPDRGLSRAMISRGAVSDRGLSRGISSRRQLIHRGRSTRVFRVAELEGAEKDLSQRVGPSAGAVGTKRQGRRRSSTAIGKSLIHRGSSTVSSTSSSFVVAVKTLGEDASCDEISRLYNEYHVLTRRLSNVPAVRQAVQKGLDGIAADGLGDDDDDGDDEDGGESDGDGCGGGEEEQEMKEKVDGGGIVSGGNRDSAGSTSGGGKPRRDDADSSAIKQSSVQHSTVLEWVDGCTLREWMRYHPVFDHYDGGGDDSYNSYDSFVSHGSGSSPISRPQPRRLSNLSDAERVNALRTVRTLRDVAEALACVHEAGVQHNDVTADNVIVCAPPEGWEDGLRGDDEDDTGEGEGEGRGDGPKPEGDAKAAAQVRAQQSRQLTALTTRSDSSICEDDDSILALPRSPEERAVRRASQRASLYSPPAVKIIGLGFASVIDSMECTDDGGRVNDDLYALGVLIQEALSAELLKERKPAVGAEGRAGAGAGAGQDGNGGGGDEDVSDDEEDAPMGIPDLDPDPDPRAPCRRMSSGFVDMTQLGFGGSGRDVADGRKNRQLKRLHPRAPRPLAKVASDLMEIGSNVRRYGSAREVVTDLDEMLDDPGRFLFVPAEGRGLDFNGDIAHKREVEVKALSDAYGRVASSADAERTGSSEAVVLRGPTGAGKSRLIQRTLRPICRYFVSGKFDECRRTQPYSAVLAAFSELCDLLLRREDADHVLTQLRAKAREGMGCRGMEALADVLPGLRRVLGEDFFPRRSSPSDADASASLSSLSGTNRTNKSDKSSQSEGICVSFGTNIGSTTGTHIGSTGTGHSRDEFLLSAHSRVGIGGGGANGDSSQCSSRATPRRDNTCSGLDVANFDEAVRGFLRAVSGSGGGSLDMPIALYLDDLQWADAPSLRLIQSILTDTDDKACRLLFVGSYRATEVNEADRDHPLLKYFASVSSHGVTVTTLDVPPLDRDAVCSLTSSALRMTTRLVRPLSDLVHRRTQGNALFARHFLEALERDGILKFDTETLLWVWDEIAVMEREVPNDDVVQLLTDKIMRLPEELREVLVVLAFLGSSFEASTIELVATRSDGGAAGDDPYEKDQGQVQQRRRRSSSSIAAAAPLERGIAREDLAENLLLAIEEGLIDEQITPASSSQPQQRPSSMASSSLFLRSSSYASFPGMLLRSSNLSAMLDILGRGRSFRFSHDRVRKACYDLVPSTGDERAALHLRIGELIWRNATDAQLFHSPAGPHLFVMVDQLNRGRALMADDVGWDRRDRLAALNLRAGERALGCGADGAAGHYLRVGAELLGAEGEDGNTDGDGDGDSAPDDDNSSSSRGGGGSSWAGSWRGSARGNSSRSIGGGSMVDRGAGENNPWCRRYELTLALTSALAEAERGAGRHDRTERLVRCVLRNAMCVHDTVGPYCSLFKSLGARDRMREAIDVGFNLLEQLGETFPRRSSVPSSSSVALDLARTKLALRGKSDETILTLPVAEEQRIIDAMRVMSAIYLYVYLARAEYLPLITFRILRLSVKHGACEATAFALAKYATVHCGALGDYAAGQRYGTLALGLLERFKATDWLARVHCAHYSCVDHWRRNVRLSIDPFMNAHRIGLKAGDVEYAMMSLHMSCCHAFHGGGENLGELEGKVRAYARIIGDRGQDQALGVHLPLWQAILNLTGQSLNRFDLTGEAMDEHAALEVAAERGNETETCVIYFFRMMLAYLFGDYELAARMGKKSRNLSESALATFVTTRQPLYEALAAFALARAGGRKQVGRRARANMKKLKKWAAVSPSNHAQGMLLLKAENAALKNKKADALRLYDAAIEAAGKNGFVQDEALANERAGLFLTERRPSGGEGKALASRYLARAHACYERWGAHAKAEDLRRKLTFELPPLVGASTGEYAYS